MKKLFLLGLMVQSLMNSTAFGVANCSYIGSFGNTYSFSCCNSNSFCCMITVTNNVATVLACADYSNPYNRTPGDVTGEAVACPDTKAYYNAENEFNQLLNRIKPQ